MHLFRHHLLPVVLFPIGLVLMVVPLSLLIATFDTGYVHLPTVIFGPVVATVVVAGLLGLTAYHTDVPTRRAEWSVLAPLLTVGAIVALHAKNVASNLLLGPRSLIGPPRTLPVAVVAAAGLVLACLLSGALGAWGMRGDPGRDRRGLGRELAALAILILVSLWPRTVTTLIADRMGWGVGETLADAWQDADLRTALRSATALAAVVLPCLLIAIVLWRRQPAAVRWRGIALVSTWIAVSAWFGQLYRWRPQLNYDNWIQTCVTGVVAGGLALAYVHGVVEPLRRRAVARGAGAPTPPEPVDASGD